MRAGAGDMDGLGLSEIEESLGIRVVRQTDGRAGSVGLSLSAGTMTNRARPSASENNIGGRSTEVHQNGLSDGNPFSAELR